MLQAYRTSIDSNDASFGNFADSTREDFIFWYFRIGLADRISRTPETYSRLVITV
jgi:hypothetical protein